jgi:purine nucleoside permease
MLQSRLPQTRTILVTLLTLMCLIATKQSAAEEPVEIKVVVAAMFEDGEARGDDAGELQFWVERSKIVKEYDFPLGEYPLFLTEEGVLIICVGGGIPNATASIMALGLDQRFDLSHAYWLIAGIAGADPLDLSLGSAAWARAVVDGDLLYEIDAREMPKEWPYGYIPLGAEAPAEKPQDIYTGWTLDTISFTLNEQLVDWAFEQTKDVEIPDAPGITEFRKLFKGFPNAQRKPFVTIGETISASTYWHGSYLNTWANDWVKVYAGQDKNFMTSNMEDSGTLTALYRLNRIGLVDAERVLILRTASNFTMPPIGEDAAWSTTAPYPDDGVPALEAAYIVGSKVVNAITKNWQKYRTQLPGIKGTSDS